MSACKWSDYSQRPLRDGSHACVDRLAEIVTVFGPLITEQTGPIPKTKALIGLRRGLVPEAERAGFEPAVGSKPYADLANRCFRPLSHLSKGRCTLSDAPTVAKVRAAAAKSGSAVRYPAAMLPAMMRIG